MGGEGEPGLPSPPPPPPGHISLHTILYDWRCRDAFDAIHEEGGCLKKNFLSSRGICTVLVNPGLLTTLTDETLFLYTLREYTVYPIIEVTALQCAYYAKKS